MSWYHAYLCHPTCDPPQPADLIEKIGAQGITQTSHTSLEEVLADTDVLYVTRVQRERFATEEEYQRVQGSYVA